MTRRREVATETRLETFHTASIAADLALAADSLETDYLTRNQ